MATVEIPERFADAVRAARKSRRWSVSEAARTAKIDRVTWQRVENAENVQDVKLDAVEAVIGFTLREVDGAVVPPSTVITAPDTELLSELLRRASARERTG